MINKVLFKTLMPFFAAAVLAVFSACGDEITEVTEVTQVIGMQVVEDGVALPECTANNEGALVYSVDSAAAYSCIGGTWTSMKGKDGKNGADGKDGKDGKNGTNGSNGKSCTVVTIDNGYKILCGGDSVGVVRNGEDGQEGAKGDSGLAGASCSAEEVSEGVKITCTDGKSFTLSNGADGKDGKSFVDGWMVDPRDKQLYRVVTIGSQTWMAENLNYEVSSSLCYNDSAKYCSKYGRLYGGRALSDVCPEGWHLPDSTEWMLLFNEVGGKVQASEKLKSQIGWNSGVDDADGNGTDAYGFSALPAGNQSGHGDFIGNGDYAEFWSSTEYDENTVYYMRLSNRYPHAFVEVISKAYALSVRCLKDKP